MEKVSRSLTIYDDVNSTDIIVGCAICSFAASRNGNCSILSL